MVSTSQISFILQFKTSITFEALPTFFFRGILGNSLRKESCITDEKECTHCIYRNRCAYAWFFESHIAKKNGVADGINRASHPFILFVKNGPTKTVKELTLEMTIIGEGVVYLPQIISAIQDAGNNGIGKERTPFTIVSVKSKGRELESMKISSELIRKFTTTTSDNREYREIEIRSLTPIRLQKDKEVLRALDYETLITACARRVRLLEGFHGTPELPDLRTVQDLILPKEIQTDLRYEPMTRYSGRQKMTHDLGGLMGTMQISGEFTEFELSLLKAGELFHIGKNTGFGLGRYQLWGI